jgi:hypothetical protein
MGEPMTAGRVPGCIWTMRREYVCASGVLGSVLPQAANARSRVRTLTRLTSAEQRRR